jgi:protein-tyrosine phosphatase
MHSVLFVCSMNICRSPMAVGLLKSIVVVKDPAWVDSWRIESAGVWAQKGYPPAVNTVIVTRGRGVDLSDQRSRPISWELINEFNLILTMEGGQKEALQTAFPEHATKIYLITELLGKKYNVIDPVGGSLAEFEETAQELEEIFHTQFDQISSLSKG